MFWDVRSVKRVIWKLVWGVCYIGGPLSSSFSLSLMFECF